MKVLTFSKKLILCLITLFSFTFTFALDISYLTEEGQPIKINYDDSEWVEDELIVQCTKGSILLVNKGYERDTKEYNLGEVKISSKLEELFKSENISSIRKVFKSFYSKDTMDLKSSRGKSLNIPDLSSYFVLRFSEKIDVLEKIKNFESISDIICVQPNYIYHVESVPNDSLFSTQWGLEQSSDEDIDASVAWNIETGVNSIKLGIFDTGIDYTHLDLGNGLGSNYKISGGYNYYSDNSNPLDNNGHGTHVAGIAAALTNNGRGIAGVAGGWGSSNTGVQVYAMKTGNSLGQFYSADIADGIVDGANPNEYDIDVLNNSYGSYSFDGTISSAVNYAACMNRVFVAAKGNDDTDAHHYPSDYSNVISVGATDLTGNRATDEDPGWGDDGGSNYGNGIDVVAPGTYIMSTMPTYNVTLNSYKNDCTDDYFQKKYDYISGTSMATPHVSGLASLILSKNSSLHPADVEGIICSSAEDKGDTGYDNEYGYGRINAQKALEYMQSPWELNHYTSTGGSVHSNTSTYTMVIGNGTYIVKRYEIRKTVSLPSNYQDEYTYIWGRGPNASTGWSAANPNYQTDYCKVISKNSSTATLKTYIYKIWTISNTYLGWYPCEASDVEFAYTILGKRDPLSVSISGPTTLYGTQGLAKTTADPYHATGTWTANVSGGGTSKSYQWYEMQSSGWQAISGETSSSLTHTIYADEDFKCVVSSEGETAYATIQVDFIIGPDLVNKSIPNTLELGDNSPNPFNPITQIKFGLPKQQKVEISVYSITGEKVKTLLSNTMKAGYHTIDWNATNELGSKVSSGIYIYQLRCGNKILNKKMIYAK